MKLRIRLSVLIFSVLLLIGASFVLAGSESLTFTIVSPANTSTQATIASFLINMTVNQSITGICNFTLGLTNSTVYANYSMTNSSIPAISNNTWWNASALDINMLVESTNKHWHNLSFICNSTGEFNVTSGLYLFKIDETNPTVTPINFTQTNTTATGYILVNTTVTDANPNVCRIGIQLESGAFTWYNINTSLTESTSYCVSRFGINNITQDGDFIVEHWANDTAARNSNSNQTGVANLLKSGWNLVTFTGTYIAVGVNESTSAIMNRLPKCTSIAIWNNQPNYKNYTTYALTTPTINNGTQIRLANSTWIYCTDNEVYLRPNYLDTIYGTEPENFTLSINNSATTGSKWNLMGMLKDKTLNQTLYTTANVTGKQEWIDAVSWYNTTLGHYISCVKAFGGSLCTTGLNATQVTITKASAVWMHVTTNVSALCADCPNFVSVILNRTAM